VRISAWCSQRSSPAEFAGGPANDARGDVGGVLQKAAEVPNGAQLHGEPEATGSAAPGRDLATVIIGEEKQPAVLPALLVLLFPEDGPEAPADSGACDPFCADLVAGLDAALAVAAYGLVLALFGWLLAIIVSTVRRTRAPRTGRS